MAEKEIEHNRLMRLVAWAEGRLNVFTLWMNAPEDLEGVWTRIATMSLIFGGLTVITLGSCLLVYGGMIGWRAIFLP